MTQTEIEISLALKYQTKQYGFKREFAFVDRMAQRAETNPSEEIEARKASYLFELLHKYRYQLPELHSTHCQDEKCRAKEAAKAVQLVFF